MLALPQALTSAHTNNIRLFFDLSRPFLKIFFTTEKVNFAHNLLFYDKFL